MKCLRVCSAKCEVVRHMCKRMLGGSVLFLYVRIRIESGNDIHWFLFNE